MCQLTVRLKDPDDPHNKGRWVAPFAATRASSRRRVGAVDLRHCRDAGCASGPPEDVAAKGAYKTYALSASFPGSTPASGSGVVPVRDGSSPADASTSPGEPKGTAPHPLAGTGAGGSRRALRVWALGFAAVGVGLIAFAAWRRHR
jgi:hypothetical protein